MPRDEKIEEKLRSIIWQHCPEVLFAGGLDILLTRNSSTLISLSRRGATSTLRVHRLFADAPDAVHEAIVQNFFCRQSRSAARELRARIMDFVDENRQLTLATTALPKVRPAQGKVYDLDKVYTDVVRKHVPERRRKRRPLQVGWSRRATPSLMGKWIETPANSPNVILINSLLDDRRVPRFYLEFIVFHEILHDLFPIRRRRGRWEQHPVEFRQREKAFPQYEEARRWEKEELGRLT